MLEEYQEILTVDEACEVLRIGYNAMYEASSKHTGMAGYGGFQRLPCRTSFCGKSIRKVNEMDAGTFPASILYSHLSARRKSLIFRCLIPLRLMSNSSRDTTYLG